MTVPLTASTAAVSVPALKAERIDYIDMSRGMLVLLMFVVHAATPCASTIRDPIQRLWVLEIATTGFAMMAGYTVGIRYDRQMSPSESGRLWKRCGELLIVMVWSNCVLGLGKLYITQQPDAPALMSWLLGLLTFRTEYGISGVLLPIALLLPLLPWIYSTEARVGKLGGLIWFTAIVGLMVLLSQLTIENDALEHIRNIFLVGLGGFSVLAFIAYGVLGYVNARVLQEGQRRGWSVGVTVVSGAILSSVLFAAMSSFVDEKVVGLSVPPGEPMLLPFVRSEVMFLGVLALGILLTSWWPECPVIKPLRLLGTYALCAFVFHRFVGQGLMISFHLHGGELGTFLLMLGVISGSTYLLCIARQFIGIVDAGLKRLYL